MRSEGCFYSFMKRKKESQRDMVEQQQLLAMSDVIEFKLGQGWVHLL